MSVKYKELLQEIDNIFPTTTKSHSQINIFTTERKSSNNRERLNKVIGDIKTQTLKMEINKRLNSQLNNNLLETNRKNYGLINSYLSKSKHKTNNFKYNTNSTNNVEVSKNSNYESSLLIQLQEERAKNKQYKEDIKELYERINFLEKSNINNSKIEEIIKENQELKEFKENIYKISQKYDEINENIIESLKEIDKFIIKLNENKFKVCIEVKFDALNNIKNNFENVLNTMISMMKVKQDEYNYLLENKDNEIKKLNNQIDMINNNGMQTEKQQFEKSAILLKKREPGNYYNNINNMNSHELIRRNLPFESNINPISPNTNDWDTLRNGSLKSFLNN